MGGFIPFFFASGEWGWVKASFPTNTQLNFCKKTYWIPLFPKWTPHQSAQLISLAAITSPQY